MIKLTMLLAMISVCSLTACKTIVYVVPVIQEPIAQEAPTHEPWQFIAIDDHNYILSEADLRVLSTYIVNLKNYADDGWVWVQYYINELQDIEKQFK